MQNIRKNKGFTSAEAVLADFEQIMAVDISRGKLERLELDYCHTRLLEEIPSGDPYPVFTEHTSGGYYWLIHFAKKAGHVFFSGRESIEHKYLTAEITDKGLRVYLVYYYAESTRPFIAVFTESFWEAYADSAEISPDSYEDLIRSYFSGLQEHSGKMKEIDGISYTVNLGSAGVEVGRPKGRVHELFLFADHSTILPEDLEPELWNFIYNAVGAWEVKYCNK